MADAPSAERPVRHIVRTALLVVLGVLVAAAAVFALVLWARYLERASARDEGLALERIEPATGATGAFEAEIPFTSMAAPAGVQPSTEVFWDDDWFFQDSSAYNHGLAQVSAVLAAVAYAESAHHQVGSGAPSYARTAYEALGFTQLDTSSYRYRSEIIDEILDFVTGSQDVVAYSIAVKPVESSATGERRLVAVVSIRGSYGAEWVSDASMLDALAAAGETPENDHSGFMRACDDIRADLAELKNAYPDEDLAVLVCGHSRGGAAANLLASYLDADTLGLRPIAALDSIYAYTFAMPATTTYGNVDDPVFDNIFNVLNPSDVVPRLPLASWGYARYGRDVWLPGEGEPLFEGRYGQMRALFSADVGAECPYDPSDAERVDAFVENLSDALPDAGSIASVPGAASIAQGLVADLDIVRVLYGHYPSVYIEWMRALTAEDMAGLVPGA